MVGSIFQSRMWMSSYVSLIHAFEENMSHDMGPQLWCAKTGTEPSSLIGRHREAGN